MNKTATIGMLAIWLGGHIVTLRDTMFSLIFSVIPHFYVYDGLRFILGGLVE